MITILLNEVNFETLHILQLYTAWKAPKMQIVVRENKLKKKESLRK